jgi:hypothetical protein
MIGSNRSLLLTLISKVLIMINPNTTKAAKSSQSITLCERVLFSLLLLPSPSPLPLPLPLPVIITTHILSTIVGRSVRGIE